MAATRSTPRGWVLSLLAVAVLASAAGRPYASDTNPNLEKLKGIEQKTLALTPPLVEATVGLSIVGGPGMGSGVIVSEDGLIMTAGHVVPAAGREMRVHFANGKVVKAKALGADRHVDAGLAQITEPGKWPYVKIGKASELKKGDWVIAIGNPGGFRSDRRPPIRIGRVLSLPDKKKGQLWIQTDATVAPGDSGGPLFNLNGEVVGIHSNISPEITQNRHVASDDYLSRWESLKSGKQTGQMFGMRFTRRGELGVQLEDVDGQVKISEIVKDSAADRAGLKVGDVILSLDRDEPKDSDDLRAKLRSKRPGREVTLSIEHDGETEEVKAHLQDGPYVIQNPPDEMEDFLKKHGYKIKDGLYEYQLKAESQDEFKQLQARYSDQRVRMAIERIDKNLSKAAPKLLDAIALVTQPVSKSVAQIYNGNDDKAIVFGTVISKNGYILTKASELKSDVYCRIDDKEYDVKVIAKNDDYDLALIKVDADNLTPVKWSSESDPTPGSLLITPAPDGKAVGMGIVSNAVREIGSSLAANKAVIGIQFAGGEEPRIGTVTEGSPAAKVGLKKGDLILAVDSKKVSKMEEVQTALKPHKPHDKIKLEVRRGEETLSFDVTLASPQIFARDRSRLEQQFGGRFNRDGARFFEQAAAVSTRKEDFPAALTHDSAVKAGQCGGPVVNLTGQVVGLNIARFDRTGTYTLTYHTLKPIVDQMLKDATKAKAAKTGPEGNP